MHTYDYFSKSTPWGVDPSKASGWTEKEVEKEIISLKKYYHIGQPGSDRISIRAVPDREGRGGFSIEITCKENSRGYEER